MIDAEPGGRRVLVIGATGETGSRVVDRLLTRGDAVRALYRTGHDFDPVVQPVQGDVRDSASLHRACEGVQTVVSCLGNRRYFGSGGMHAVDVVGTRNLVSAAAACGVEHFVLLSAFGLDRRSVLLTVFSAVLNRYFHHKQRVEDAVRESGIPFTIVRPHELRNRPPRGTPILNQTEPLSLLRTVSRDTVADVLVGCVWESRVVNAVFEVVEGGHAPLTDQFDRLQRDGRMHLRGMA